MTVSQDNFRAAMMNPSAAVPAGIVNPDGAAASKRFDVYRNNVAVSLTEALEAGFPVIRKLVGDEFFRAMAGVYLRLHPPKSPLMMFYGQEMPQFLARFEPSKGLKYLPDMARLELAMRDAYHAADAAPIAADALTTIAPDALMGVKFGFAPALRVIQSDYPIHSIYLANTQADAPKPTPGAETVLITRPGFDPQINLLSKAAAACLTAFQSGQSMGQAMATADPALDLGGLLGLLLSQSALTSVKI